MSKEGKSFSIWYVLIPILVILLVTGIFLIRHNSIKSASKSIDNVKLLPADTYTVRFSPNGGKVDNELLEIEAGNEIVMPTAKKEIAIQLFYSASKAPKVIIQSIECKGWLPDAISDSIIPCKKTVIPESNSNYFAVWDDEISVTLPKLDFGSDNNILGWTAEPNGKKAEYFSGGKIDLDPDQDTVTLYAVSPDETFTVEESTTKAVPSTKTEYTLTYNANGGIYEPSPQKGNGIIYISSQKPQRSGYNFVGWSTSPSGEPKFKAGEKVRISGDVIVYAVWEKETTTSAVIKYLLSYNGNGGSGAPSSQEGNGTVYISQTRPTRQGYSFKGWATSSYASEPQYYPGNTIYMNDNITLYAVWKSDAVTTETVRLYELTYNGNGGSGAPSSQSGNGTAYISQTKPSRSGYLFKGWATSSSASEPQYLPGNKINLNSNITLYAVWEKEITTTKASALNASFSAEKSDDGNDINVSYSFRIQSNYCITDYVIYYVDPNGQKYWSCRLKSECSGKYNGHNGNSSDTFSSAYSGQTIKYIVYAQDTSGKTINKEFFVKL